MTSNPDAVTRNEAKVLSYLVDDYCGLREVLATVDNDLACARLVLESLIARGWVQLFRRRRPSAFEPLQTESAHDALRAPQAWQLPPDALWVTTTVSGEEACKSLPQYMLPRDRFPRSWVNPKGRA